MTRKIVPKSGVNGKTRHEHLEFLSWFINRKPSVDQLIEKERAVSDFLGDPLTSPATISIWSPLQPHLSGLHQVAFLQISQSATHMGATTHWAFCWIAPLQQGCPFKWLRLTDGRKIFLNFNMIYRHLVYVDNLYRGHDCLRVETTPL